MKLHKNYVRAARLVGVACWLGWAGQSVVVAQTTNIVWKADFKGSLGDQIYLSNLDPKLTTAKFNTKKFLTMVLGNAPTKNQVLGLSVNVLGGTTNLALSVYDTSLRQNVFYIAAGETILLHDWTNFACSVVAAMPSRGTNWGGGLLQIAGRGKEVEGFPANLKANVGGYMLDHRPGDAGGTTGLILRATLKTSGKPLRVEQALTP